MKISLIITTYNWPEALDRVIQSAMIQTQLPDEIIIADDGSREETAEIVHKWQSLSEIPLIHCWQEDLGFRAALCRNRAIKASSSDYIVLIDGDMVLPKQFIAEHCKLAKKGQFIQASRITMDNELSQKILNSNKIPNFLSRGLGNRKNCIHSKFLSYLFTKPLNSTKRTRSCNMAFWRDDALAINGFNNDFIDWGYEDTDFTQRLLNKGIQRKYAKFTAAAFHIYHKQLPKDEVVRNRELFEESKKNALTAIKNGISEVT